MLGLGRGEILETDVPAEGEALATADAASSSAVGVCSAETSREAAMEDSATILETEGGA